MSKAGKGRRALERKRKRKNAKEARKALYKGYADQGQNSKSKRASLRSKRLRTVKVSNHVMGPCGNTGCLRCNPSAAPRLGHRAWMFEQGLLAAQRPIEASPF